MCKKEKVLSRNAICVLGVDALLWFKRYCVNNYGVHATLWALCQIKAQKICLALTNEYFNA